VTRAQRMGLADRYGRPDPRAASEGRHPMHRWVLRSIVGGRKIPGWGETDPLTLPFLARPSVHRKLTQRARVAQRDATTAIDTDTADAQADRWVALALAHLPGTCADSLWCRCAECDRAFRWHVPTRH
jgi:hypothetical protein